MVRNGEGKMFVRLVVGVGLGAVMLMAFAVISYAAGAGGSAVYAQYCVRCHGETGQGTPYGPDIAGESQSEVREVTRNGDDVMPGFGPSIIRDEDLAALAQYVGAMSGSVSNDGHHDYERNDDAADNESEDNASGGQYGQCRPELSIDAEKSSWKSLSAYTEGILTVVYKVENHSENEASLVKVIGISHISKGVVLNTALPVHVGDITGGSSHTFKLEYSVSNGTHKYRNLLHATAVGCDGATYHYPSKVENG